MEGMTYRYILLFFLIGLSGAVLAQPANDECDDALNLCAGQPMVGDNTGSLGTTGFCPTTSTLLWYTFMTNSVGGDANVSMSNLNCTAGAGFGNEMSAVILTGNGSCTLPSFSAVSACTSGSSDFTVTATSLLANTTYWVLVAGVQNGGATSPANCSFFIEASGPGVDIIDVDFDAGSGFEIQDGETVQLNASGPGPVWSWTPTAGLSSNNIPNPFATPSVTTTYTVSETINGCLFMDTVTVEVVRLINPPNTFTPNGDGFNDTWEIPGINAFPNAQVTVFDRWGQKVFTVNGYSEEWDGTRNGTELNTATFYYTIRLNRLEGQVPPITGSVTIVR